MEYKMEWNNHCRKKNINIDVVSACYTTLTSQGMYAWHIYLSFLFMDMNSEQTTRKELSSHVQFLIISNIKKNTHTHININIMNTNKLRECEKNNKNLTTFATTGIMSRALWMFNRIRISILLCESFFLDLKNFTRNFFFLIDFINWHSCPRSLLNFPSNVQWMFFFLQIENCLLKPPPNKMNKIDHEINLEIRIYDYDNHQSNDHFFFVFVSCFL